MVNHSDDHVLRLTRLLPAPPAAVWRALTDPEALAAWFWPARRNPSAETDPRVGGRFALTADAMAVTGTYVEFDPPRRLVFTWRWAGDDEETLVSIELSTDDGRRALSGGVRRHDGGTRLDLTHERFAGDEDRDNHATGWSDCLDRLPPYLATVAVRPA